MSKKKAKKDTIDQDEIEQEYGLSYALFKAFPELNTLLHHAVNQSWTAQRFQVELRQTKWFKQHSDSWRQMTALKYSDPQSYQERLAQARTSVMNLAGEFSATNITKAAMNRLVERSLLLGLNDDQVKDLLASHVVPSKTGQYGGDLASIQSNLRSTALNNGVRVGAGEMRNWMRAIVRGNASQEQYENYIRNIAAQTFGAYGEQIKGGMNLSDVAAPYVQSMSQVLELNPQSIDMFDPTIRKALAYKDDKGNSVPMSITDFEDQLRQDKRWQYTKQAKDSAMGFATALASQWGLA